MITIALTACGSGTSSSGNAAPAGTSATTPPPTTQVVASDGVANDYLGGALWYDTFSTPIKPVYYATPGEAALDDAGRTALVGAPGHAHNDGKGSGGAYVFTSTGAAWAQSTELRASDAAAYDGFGWSVALSGSGTRAVVGAPTHDTTQVDAGEAYVFDRTSTGWRQAAILRADAPTGYDSFGWNVGIARDGTTIIAGATGHDVNGVNNAGAAYVFRLGASGWTQTAMLTAAQPTVDDKFGAAVAISGNGTVAAVTTRDDLDSKKTHHIGRVAFFTTTDGWATTTPGAVVTHGNRNADGSIDAFGVNTTLSDHGTVAAVAAPDVNVGPNGTGAGVAYVYTTADNWQHAKEIKVPPPHPAPYGYYGSSVALSAPGDVLAIGADNEGTNGQGTAYLVRPQSGGAFGWSGQLEQEFFAAPHDAPGRFGTAIAISANAERFLATSPLLPVDNAKNRGAAFIVPATPGSK